MNAQNELNFDGATYEPQYDCKRLTGQLQRVFELMSDETWRTLEEIAWDVGGSTQSMSARLRDMRKSWAGSHAVNRRRKGDGGVWEYQLIVQKDSLQL